MKIADTYNVDARFKVGDRVRVWKNSVNISMGFGIDPTKEHIVVSVHDRGRGIILKNHPMDRGNYLIGHHWEVIPKENNVAKLLAKMDEI